MDAMEHEAIKEEIEALHDGELEAARRAEISAHIQECSDCREFSSWLDRSSAAFFHAIETPSGGQIEAFTRRVMIKIKQDGAEAQVLSPGFDWGLLWAPAFGLGFAVFVLLTGRWSGVPASPDAVLLVDARDKSVAEMVLPPDLAQGDNLLASLMEGR